MGSDRAPIENQICDWHLPVLEQNKPAKKRVREHTYNKTSNESQSYQFQHFADTTMYIDDYRRKHTVANAATDFNTISEVDPRRSCIHETDCHISQYIDIRVPERKICLTGLPQLKVPSHHHTPRRNTNTLHDFPSDIPHLPHLKLNGISKKIKERKFSTTKEEHRKAKSEKRKKSVVMSRFQPELKPTVRKLPVSARRSPTRFPSVSSISPRQSVDAADSDMKWTVDMIRGITIPCSQRENDKTRGNRSAENTERSSCTVKDHEKLYQKNVSLQKLVSQLRDEIKEKNKTTMELQEKIRKNEIEFKTAMTEHDNIVKKHDNNLEVLYNEIKELKNLVSDKMKETEVARHDLDETKRQCEAKVDSIIQKTELQISSLCKNHDKEMAERDGKLAFLKTQLESALNSNSKERQRQLDELTKELTRVTDEMEMLKAKLRALANQKQNDKCRNCVSLEEVLQTKLQEIRQKDGSIVELLKHCQKMSVQLSKTDEFVKLLEENKLKYG